MSRHRDELIEDVRRLGREHSDATVVFHGAVAARLGVHPSDHKTMGLLQQHGPMTAGEITRRTGLAAASVTALVDRLEARGLARRVRDRADRRRTIVEPTDEGIAEIAPYFAGPRRSLGRLLDHYGDDELAVIADFLTRSTARLRDETALLSQEPHDASAR
jgi:DNA-binding MarR family transcriptional regulator